MKIPLLDFDRSQYVDVPIGGEYLDLIAYPKELENFDKIIYLPIMKTHYLAGFTMSLKLTVGLVHLSDRTILHGDNNMFVSQRAAEMNIPVKPDLPPGERARLEGENTALRSDARLAQTDRHIAKEVCEQLFRLPG